MTRAFATNQDLDPVQLRQAFGVFPTGVVAVSALVKGEVVGLAASSFTAVSLNPPLISVSIAQASQTWGVLRHADHLGVTVLADHHGPIARQLAGPVESRFDDVLIHTSAEGSVTITDGIAHFDTTIYKEVEAGDHLIVLLQLHAVAHAGDDSLGKPLVYHRSKFTKMAPTS